MKEAKGFYSKDHVSFAQGKVDPWMKVEVGCNKDQDPSHDLQRVCLVAERGKKGLAANDKRPDSRQ